MRTTIGVFVCAILAASAAAADSSASRAPTPPAPRPVMVVADSGPPADNATVRALKISGAAACVEPRNGPDGDRPGLGRLRFLTREEALAIIDRLDRQGRIVHDSQFSLLPDAAAEGTARSVDRTADGAWKHTLEVRARLVTRRPRPAPSAGAPVAGPCSVDRPDALAAPGARTRAADVMVRSATQVGKQVPRVGQISTSVDVTTTNALLFETAAVVRPGERRAQTEPFLWLVVITGNRDETPVAGRPAAHPMR